MDLHACGQKPPPYLHGDWVKDRNTLTQMSSDRDLFESVRLEAFTCSIQLELSKRLRDHLYSERHVRAEFLDALKSALQTR